jgi:hypothetical protein
MSSTARKRTLGCRAWEDRVKQKRKKMRLSGKRFIRGLGESLKSGQGLAISFVGGVLSI